MSNLPVKKGDDFIGELESMDLSSLKDKVFIVGVSTGDRNGPKMITSTIRGPLTFVEMVEQIGCTWQEHQHHAKAMILEKDMKVRPKFIDENTADYIECHYMDIVTEAMLDGVFDEDKTFTCQAGLNDISPEEDPRNKVQELGNIEEDEL
jgi:hypothetical protein